VSWTILESTAFGCDVVFPNFRSFPEFIPQDRLYMPFSVADAVQTLNRVVWNSYNKDFSHLSDIADLGRRTEAFIMVSDYDKELNIWHEAEYCKYLINQYNEGNNE